MSHNGWLCRGGGGGGGGTAIDRLHYHSSSNSALPFADGCHVYRGLSCVTSSSLVACSFMAQDADAATAGPPAVSTHVGVLWCRWCRRWCFLWAGPAWRRARFVAFLSLRESSYIMSPSWIECRHVLRSVAAYCHCVVEVFDCFNVSLSESFQRRSGRATVLVPVVSSPNNNCFGIRHAGHMTIPPKLQLANNRKFRVLTLSWQVSVMTILLSLESQHIQFNLFSLLPACTAFPGSPSRHPISTS